MEKNIEKIEILGAVISKIQDEGEPDKIEVKDLKEYDTPSKIPANKMKEIIIPDLAVHNNDELNLYEIELEDQLNPEKWKRMSLHARKHRGHLYLVVPDYLREKVKNELKNNQVNAGLIYFDINPETRRH